MTTTPQELAIERTIDAPRDTVWRVVTEHFAEWWSPRPWTTEVVAIERKSGGRFAITMHGPVGEVHAGDGMLLDVVPGERFVFTNTLGGGWTPQVAQPVAIVGTFALADADNGRTRFRSTARHWTAADAEAHDAMGFAQGWGTCADQLTAVSLRLTGQSDA